MRYQSLTRRVLACGIGHWAVADKGNAKIMIVNTPVNTELIGTVIDVACGRHHTLLLTENGVCNIINFTFVISSLLMLL